MSLSIGAPEPRRRTQTRKPASKKATARRVKTAPAAPVRRNAPQLPDAERLFRRFEQLLPDGDHAFSQLRQDFDEWCAIADIAPASGICLAGWLVQAGLVKERVGRQKTTIYRKPTARSAMRLAA